MMLGFLLDNWKAVFCHCVSLTKVVQEINGNNHGQDTSARFMQRWNRLEDESISRPKIRLQGKTKQQYVNLYFLLYNMCKEINTARRYVFISYISIRIPLLIPSWCKAVITSALYIKQPHVLGAVLWLGCLVGSLERVHCAILCQSQYLILYTRILCCSKCPQSHPHCAENRRCYFMLRIAAVCVLA